MYHSSLLIVLRIGTMKSTIKDQEEAVQRLMSQKSDLNTQVEKMETDLSQSRYSFFVLFSILDKSSAVNGQCAGC